MLHIFRSTALLACVLPAVLAQEPASPEPRATVAGRLTSADGTPWGGATVVLTAHTTPCARELGRIDRVEVTTSDSGIFRAKVLTGLGYSAHAFERLADGSFRRSKVRHGVVPGALVAMEEADPQKPFSIRVKPGEAWADLAPFSIRIVHAHPNLETVEVPLDADHTTEAPLLLDGWAGCHVVDKNGEPLCERRINARSRAVRNGVFEFPLPEPVTVPVFVSDETGAPLVGAEIRLRVHRGGYFTEPYDLLTDSQRLEWRNCGKTGEDGRATIRAPLKFDPFGPLEQRRWKEAVFSAHLEGRQQAQSGHCQENVFWNGERQTDDAKELRFLLRGEAPLSGRILLSEGQPLVGTPVLITTDCKMNAHQNGWTHLELRFTTVTDAEGRWSIPSFPGDGQYTEVSSALPEPLREQLRIDDLQAGRYAMLPIPQPGKPSEVDLSTLAPLRVEVLDAEQGPAVGAQLQVFDLTSDDRSGVSRDVPWVRRIDRRGRVLLHLRPGKYGLIAASEDGFTQSEFEVARAEPGDETGTLSLSIEPWPTMRLRVKGSDGGVPESIHSYISSYSYAGSASPFEDAVREALQGVLSAFADRPRWEDGVLHVRCRTFPNSRMELQISARGYEGRDVEIRPTVGEPEELILQKSN